MEGISYTHTERKTNIEVLGIVEEPRTLISSIKKRRWRMVGHILRHGEEPHNIIAEGLIEGRRGAGRPRTTFMSQLLTDAGVTKFSDLKRMAEDLMDWRGIGNLL